MRPERWQRVQEVFKVALTRPPEDRAAYLDETCAGDPELQAEVEAMLAADATAGDVVGTAVGSAAQLLTDPITAAGKFGKYEILGKIGQGGFGQVHKGRDPMLKRSVAIKTCTSDDPQLRQRFFREAQISAQLQHPNITTVHDFGFEHGIPFLVQELLSGEDLQQKISRRDPWPLARRLDALLQVARGLAHAHEQGVTHRDVKPANVRVLDSGAVKILDFGIARIADESTRITGTGIALGTVGYLAPEQLQGSDVDHRSDVFSFGVLAYELLSYRRPFEGETVSQITYRLVSEDPPPLTAVSPGCPPALAAVVERCLEKRPADRYLSLAPVIADLESLTEQLATADEEATWVMPVGRRGGPETRQTRRRRPRRWAAGGAALLLVPALLWLARGVIWPPSALESETETTAIHPPAGEASTDVPAIQVPADPPSSPAGPTAEHPGVDESASEPSAGGEVDDEPRPAASGVATSRDESVAPPPPRATPPPTRVEPQPAELRAQPLPAETGGVKSPSTAPSPTGFQETERQPVPPNAPPPAAAPPPESQAAGQDRPETPTARPPPRVAPPAGALPPRPAPASAGLITPGAGVVEPQLLQRPQPRYPERAQRRKKEARVVLAVLVTESGEVARALVKRCSVEGFGFKAAAVAAARRARFRPATRDGIRGRMWTEISFDFRLD